MRKVFTMFFCSISIIASATDYYVSSSGDDSADGLSPSTPWQTITKVNSELSKITAGDKILFKRGETFQGTLTVSQSGTAGNPIVFDAYGSGAEPVISGFTSINGWTSEGGGIYSKSITCQSAPNILTLDDKNVARGRWPNAGWMIIDSFTGSTSIYDAALPSLPDWDGAEVIVRTAQCLVDRSIIQSHSGQTLTFTPITQDPVVGSGYFIQNHRSALDVYGEWCYTNGTIYMYFGSENPSNHIVKVSVMDKLVDINFKNYITFKNIHFEGGNFSNVCFYNSDFITIQNCIVEKGGRYGIFGRSGSDNVKIENNRVTHNNNIGIYFEWDACVNTNIRNNTVSYSGYLLGMGLSGYDSYCGIISSGTNSITSYNKVENTGYTGIKFGGENAEVSYNFINYSCLNKDDGGGIYSFRDYNPNKVIKYNIVLNSLASPDGWHYYEDVRSHGIYLDGAYNVLVTHNTVASNDGCGIFMNAGRGVTSEYNTCYDNVWGIRVLSEPDIGLARNHNINNNILFAKEYIVPPSSQWKQSAFGFVTKLDESDIAMFGTSDNNYFARPINDDNYIDVWYGAWDGLRSAYNLSEWKSKYGKDSHSQSTPITVTDTSKIKFLYNASTSNKVVSLDGSYTDVKGAKYNGSITLAPYTSAVLMVDPNPSAPPAVPAYVSSEIKDGAPAILEMTYNLSLANIVPAASSFSVQVNSAARSVSSVSVSGTKVLLTLSSPVAYGNTVTVAYNKPSSNPLQTSAGGQAVSLSVQSVTNRVAAPPAPAVPAYVSSEIKDAARSVVEMTYSLSLANIVPAASAFTVQVNSTARSVSSVSVSGTKVLLTLSSPAAYGNTVTVAYTKPSSNPLQTSAGGQAATIGAQSVTNRIAAPAAPAVPVYASAAVENAAPSVVEITYSLALASIVPAVSAFTVQVNGAARSVSSVSVSGTRVLLTLSSPVVYGNTVTVAYTKPSSNPLQTSAGGQAATIGAQAVTNRVNQVTPPPVVNPPPVVTNTPPVPVVKFPQRTYTGFVGEINASESYDADKDNLSFSWKIPDNIPVSSETGGIIQFLAPVIESDQTYEFILTVSDGKTTQTKIVPIVIVPFEPELETAEVISATASNYYSTNHPSNAIDGNIGTMWSSKGEEQSLILELKSPYIINHVKIAFQPGQKSESYFDIFGSNDGETWEPILTKASSCSFSGGIHVFVFPLSKSISEFRFLKFVGLGNSVDTWNYISEFRVFGYRYKKSADFEDLIVKLYPNPARELVNVRIDDDGFNPDFVRILAMDGKVMYSDIVDPLVRNFQIPVNFNHGVYIVQMGTGNITMFTQKLVVFK